jgi:hypothetical protein
VPERGFSKKSTINPYYTMVVARSRIDDWSFPLPKFDSQVCLLEHDVQALEIIGLSTADILDYIDNIMVTGNDILLDPQKHDQLLFDHDNFFLSSGKYWWVLNLLNQLRQNIEVSRNVHEKFMDDLIAPIIGITTGAGASRDTSTWPDGLKAIEQRATRAVERLGKLLERIYEQKIRVDTLRDAVSTYLKILQLQVPLTSK